MILSLLNKITDGGKITEEDVNNLRKHLLNEDGSYNVNREIADKLFELFNMAKNEQVVDNIFYMLFTDAICAHLLKDQSSTGVLDDREVDWLVGKIESNMVIDDKLFDLIQELKAKSFNKFTKKLDSAIILRRLRGILEILSDSETDKECKKQQVDNNITSLENFLKDVRNSVDEDCVTILFSIKNKLVQNKKLGFNFAENLKKKNTVEYKFAKLFYDIVSAFVLYDEHSPYNVDDEEAKQLIKRINQKATADFIDNALLEQLKSKSMGFPELLAKAHLDISTSEVRYIIVNELAKEKKDAKEEENAKEKLDEYISKSFGCIDEQKVKAELLFDLKNLTEHYKTIKEEDIEFHIREKYKKQVTKYITGAESQSPNEIDDEDEKWLNSRFRVSKSRYYRCDEELLIQLKKSSVNYPHSLELRLSGEIMMRKLRELKDSEKVLSDKDLDELKDAIFDDNDEFKIDSREAAEFIFKIKDIIYEKDKKINQGFSRFFVKVVSSYLLGDKKSPGKIDEAETEWLLAKINKNDKTDKYDKALLEALEKKSINHPDVLHYTGWWKDGCRQVLYISRKISWIAIWVSIIASLFLFMKGAVHVYYAGKGFIQCELVKGIKFVKSEDIFVEIVEAIDSFLVAMVVFILGIGIFELFIRKMEKPYKVNEKRPSWMQMNSIDDLKSSLVKVLIIAMIVGFYKKTLSPSFNKETLLFSAIGIVLIAIAFCVTEISAHYHNKSKNNDEK